MVEAGQIFEDAVELFVSPVRVAHIAELALYFLEAREQKTADMGEFPGLAPRDAITSEQNEDAAEGVIDGGSGVEIVDGTEEVFGDVAARIVPGECLARVRGT